MEFRASRSQAPLLEMAPLVDVVFLLLIFFMLTSTFIKPEHIELDLPNAESANPLEKDKALQITIDKEGELFTEGKKTTLEDLHPIIESHLKEGPEKQVVIRSDGSAPIKVMVSVMDKVRVLGGSNLSLETQQVEE